MSGRSESVRCAQAGQPTREERDNRYATDASTPTYGETTLAHPA